MSLFPCGSLPDTLRTPDCHCEYPQSSCSPRSMSRSREVKISPECLAAPQSSWLWEAVWRKQDLNWAFPRKTALEKGTGEDSRWREILPIKAWKYGDSHTVGAFGQRDDFQWSDLEGSHRPAPSPTIFLPSDLLSESKPQTEFSSSPDTCEQADPGRVFVCFLFLMVPQLHGMFWCSALEAPH